MKQRTIYQRLIAASMALAFTAHALTTSTEINFSGTVVDDEGKAISGVIFAIKNSDLSSTTNSKGEWALLQNTSSILSTRAVGDVQGSQRTFNVMGRFMEGENLAQGSYIIQNGNNGNQAQTRSLTKTVTSEPDSLIVTYKGKTVARYQLQDLRPGEQEPLTLVTVTPLLTPAKAGTVNAFKVLLGQSATITYDFDEVLWRPTWFTVDGRKFWATGKTYTVEVNSEDNEFSLELRSRLQKIEFASVGVRSYGDIFTVNPVAVSKLPVTVTSKTEKICTIEANLVSLINVGECELVANQAGNDTLNEISVTHKFTVNPKLLTVKNAIAANKVYDGTVAASGIEAELVGKVGKDTIGLAVGTAKFADKKVGIAKTVTVTGSKIDGPSGRKYTVGTFTATADITPKLLTIVNAAVTPKEFDNTNTATVVAELEGVIKGDQVSIVYGSSTYASIHASPRISVSSTGTGLTGADAANYTRTKIGMLYGAITSRTVPVTVRISDKYYDGTTGATIASISFNDDVFNYKFSLNQSPTATFASANAAANVPVNVSVTPIYPNDFRFEFPAGLSANINKRPITIDISNATKVYGDEYSDKFGVTISNEQGMGLASGDGFSLSAGSECTGASLPVSSYNVNLTVSSQNVINNAKNYQVTVNSGTCTITPRPITVTAYANQNIAYGDAEPNYAYSITSGELKNGDELEGNLSRTNLGTKTVGEYEITQGTLTNAMNPNYNITFNKATFVIKQKDVTVIPTVTSKIIGAVEPTLDYTLEPALLGGDVLEGLLTRAAGEDVGEYAFIITGLTNPNYKLSLASGAKFTIKPFEITVTAEPKEITYGDELTELTFTTDPASLPEGVDLKGELSREVGDDAGSYKILRNSLELDLSSSSSSQNYTLIFVGANYVINKRKVTVSLDPNETSKTYGESDPEEFSFTTDLSENSNLNNKFLVALGEGFSYGRDVGEDVGSYNITPRNAPGSMKNFIPTFNDGVFTIEPLAITIYPNQNQQKTYGDDDDEIQFTTDPEITSSMAKLNGSLTYDYNGDHKYAPANIYDYTLGTITEDANPNYTIGLDYMSSYVIEKKELTVTPTNSPLVWKIWSSTTSLEDSSIVTQDQNNVKGPFYTLDVVNGDDVQLTLTSNGSSFASSDVGQTTATVAYTEELTGADAANYAIIEGTFDAAAEIVHNPDVKVEFKVTDPASYIDGADIKEFASANWPDAMPLTYTSLPPYACLIDEVSTPGAITLIIQYDDADCTIEATSLSSGASAQFTFYIPSAPQ